MRNWQSWRVLIQSCPWSGATLPHFFHFISEIVLWKVLIVWWKENIEKRSISNGQGILFVRRFYAVIVCAFPEFSEIFFDIQENHNYINWHRMAFSSKLFEGLCICNFWRVFSCSVLRFSVFNYRNNLVYWCSNKTGKSRFELLFSLCVTQRDIYLSHSIQTLNSQCLHGRNSSLELVRYIIAILAKSTAPITYSCQLPFVLNAYSHLAKSNTKEMSLTVWLLIISI